MTMHLIGFHRFLILCAIVFFFGYGAWEMVGYRGSGEPARFVAGAGSLLAGIALTYYLLRLRRFLRLRD
jgi:hypothetical protein